MKLSSMAILLVAVGAMMLPAMPSAMAMPDVSSGCFPSPIVAGADCEIKVTANGKSTIEELNIYENDGTNQTPDDDDECSLPNADNSISVWELKDTTNTFRIQAFLPQGETMKVLFKSGTVTVSVSSVGSGLTDDGSAPDATDPESVSAIWDDINLSVPASTGTLTPPDLYFILACGEDILGAGNLKYQSSGVFENQAPVGGELLQINTAALLVAGISTSSLWMVPILGAVVGYGVYRLSTKKHN